jgi:Domain of unknown function (DUF4232)
MVLAATAVAAVSLVASGCGSEQVHRPVAADQPCQAPDMEFASFAAARSGTHATYGLALRNLSGHACTTIGYPTIQFVRDSGSDSGGGMLNLPPIANTTPRLVHLAAGGLVSFRVQVSTSDFCGCRGRCDQTFDSLSVTLPDTTAAEIWPFPHSELACPPAYESPLERGTAAFPHMAAPQVINASVAARGGPGASDSRRAV